MKDSGSRAATADEAAPATRRATGAGAGGWDGKFAVPLATHLVSRPRLHARLTAGLQSCCMLIAAPAGWGKTLLTGSWLAEGGAADRAAAWISLGPAEDDVRALWTAVATAIAPVVGEQAAADLRRVVTDDNLETVPGQIAAILADDATPVVLVLDNLHELTSLAVHESLLRLVGRPPQGLRLVATTRRDPPWPLDRLRLAGVITEIRAAELAFRIDETAALLAQLGIDLDDTHVGRLVERTEGWAAGLRLAALQLQGDADPAGFVDAFSGDDHAVAAYLLTEVIDRQTPELLDFLVHVSFVDLVSADLADALTGARNGARTGADTLAELAASNLFVHAVGPGGRWYRLHRLIADVLRARITDPRTLRDVHRRAAEWYRRHSMPLDAVRYALRGRLWPLAAELLSVHGLALVIRGSARELDVLLSAAPRDGLLGQPELAATLAAARIYLGSNREVRELVAAAAAGVDDLPQPRAERLRVVLDLVETGHARTRGDLVALAAAARRVPDDPRTLSGLGLAGWDVIPLLVLGNAGTAELWTGDIAEAEKHLRAAVDTTQWSGLLRPHLNAAAQLALLLAERGDLDAAQADAHAAVAARNRSGLGGIGAGRRRLPRARLGIARPGRTRRRRPLAPTGRRGRGRRTRTARPTRRRRAEHTPPRRHRRLGRRTHRPAGHDRADRKRAARPHRPSTAGGGRTATPNRRPAASSRRPDQAARPGHAAHRPRPRPAAPRRRRHHRGRAGPSPPSPRCWAPLASGWTAPFCTP